jgi:nicotinamide-nucleotide amidase
VTAARAAILVTGSEILLGRTVDTNSSFVARELDGFGIRVIRTTAVDDRPESITSALRELLATGVDIVVTSGGLGPTHDDVTMDCVAEVAGLPRRLDAAVLAAIEQTVAAFATARGTDPAAYERGNRKQATVPDGADILGPVGTAPGAVVPAGRQRIVVLPGPPGELTRMWTEAVASPLLRPLLGTAEPRRVLRLYGVPESQVADAFADLGGDEGGTETTICASRAEIEIVIRHDPAAAPAAEQLAAGFRAHFGRALFAEGPERLEEIVLRLLAARSWRLAVAESCTAGLVAARLADVPGASAVLAGGVIAYADDVKRAVLGVPAATLAEHGAVSPETARAMAEGARRLTGAEVAVAVTGIAGPGGATAGKPVGLVCLHVVGPGGERSLERRFPGTRASVRDWSATAALHLVRLFERDA